MRNIYSILFLPLVITCFLNALGILNNLILRVRHLYFSCACTSKPIVSKNTFAKLLREPKILRAVSAHAAGIRIFSDKQLSQWVVLCPQSVDKS